jgi:hypothetical protein
MKRLLNYLPVTALSLAFNLFFLMIPARSQDKTKIFTNIDFNKVSPEKVNDYLNLEGKIWKPIQQEHMKQGGLAGWNVFRVWFTGTGSEYNYAVMELYRNYEDMSFVYSNDIIAKVHPGINESKLMDDTYHAREIAKAQSAVRIAMIRPEIKKEPFKYVIVTYLDIKKSNEALFEKNIGDVVLPAFKERMSSGMCKGWDLFKLVIPNGDSVPFQYMSFEYIDSMGQVVQQGGPDAMKGMEPGKVFRTEFWEGVEFLGGE